MQSKEIMSLVRKAVEVVNISPVINTTIDPNREDSAVAADFISFCKGIPENTEVPVAVSTAWEAIPDEWLEGKFPEPTAEEGYNECKSFGKYSARSKACKRCQTQNIDEHIRCQKATEINRKPAREPAGTSRYGHILGSKSAFIDDFIVDGVDENTLIAKMQEQWPEMTTSQAVNKIRSHIAWLPRVRGVEVTITRTDDGIHYKAAVEKWCGSKDAVIPVTNIRIDKRTAVVEKAEKKVQADGEKKLREEKKKVKDIKSDKTAKKDKKAKKEKKDTDTQEAEPATE